MQNENQLYGEKHQKALRDQEKSIISNNHCTPHCVQVEGVPTCSCEVAPKMAFDARKETK